MPNAGVGVQVPPRANSLYCTLLFLRVAADYNGKGILSAIFLQIGFFQLRIQPESSVNQNVEIYLYAFFFLLTGVILVPVIVFILNLSDSKKANQKRSESVVDADSKSAAMATVMATVDENSSMESSTQLTDAIGPTGSDQVSPEDTDSLRKEIFSGPAKNDRRNCAENLNDLAFISEHSSYRKILEMLEKRIGEGNYYLYLMNNNLDSGLQSASLQNSLETENIKRYIEPGNKGCFSSAVLKKSGYLFFSGDSLIRKVPEAVSLQLCSGADVAFFDGQRVFFALVSTEKILGCVEVESKYFSYEESLINTMIFELRALAERMQQAILYDRAARDIETSFYNELIFSEHTQRIYQQYTGRTQRRAELHSYEIKNDSGNPLTNNDLHSEPLLLLLLRYSDLPGNASQRAGLFRSRFKEYDCYRIAADTFAIIGPFLSDEDVSDRIRKSSAGCFVSGGGAILSDRYESVHDWIGRANSALIRAEQAGEDYYFISGNLHGSIA